jgi:hypothetical protein
MAYDDEFVMIEAFGHNCVNLMIQESIELSGGKILSTFEECLIDLKYKDKYIVYEYNEKASPNYIGCRFMSSYTPKTDEEKLSENLFVVDKNISLEKAQLIIHEKKEKNVEAFLSEYPPELLEGNHAEFIKKLLNEFD